MEDLFDTVGAEHSLPFRRFLIYAPSLVAKLPSDHKWRAQNFTASTETHSSTSDAKDVAKAAQAAQHQAINRQIVEAQSRLDRIQEEIATGESTLAAMYLKIHAAEDRLEELETLVSEKETQLDAYNLVKPVRSKTPSGNSSSSSVPPTQDTPAAETTEATSEQPPEIEESDSDSESESDSPAPTQTEPVGHEESTDSVKEDDKPEPTEETQVTAEPTPAPESAITESHDGAESDSGEHKHQKKRHRHSHHEKKRDEHQTAVLESTEDSTSKPLDDSTPSDAVKPDEPVDSEENVAPPKTPKKSKKTDTADTSTTSDSTPEIAYVSLEETTPKRRRKQREVQLDFSGSTDSVPTSAREKDKRDKKSKTKDKKEKTARKEKEKLKTKEKRSKKQTPSTPGVSTPDTLHDSNNDSIEIQLDDVPLNKSAYSKDPLRSPQSARSSTTPQISPRAVKKDPASPISFPSNTPEDDLPGEKLALIDKTFFASIDVKLQAIIDGLQPHQHILDLSYFNLVVYIQGLNASLTNVATRLPNASTVPQHLLAPAAGTVKKPSVVQLQPRISNKASVVGLASVQISPSSPTPPTTTLVRTPLLGYLVSGPYFAVATGDMINSLGDTLVQCLNNLLISIQDSRSKSPSLLAALCSSWKAQLYRSICTAYHSMRNLANGITSDLAQYFFPATPPPADDPTSDRGLNSVYNQIALPPTNVNDDYLPDPVALEILATHQATDAQLIPREEFMKLFSVYFGQGVMDHLLYILDPWATHNVHVKRFAEFLRLFGTVVGAACYRRFQEITATTGFQAYLTESVALTLLEQQTSGTFCLWYNKVRPKFGVLNLSWVDSLKEVVSSTTITISSTHSPSGEPTFHFGFDYEGLSISAPTLPELIVALQKATLDDEPLITQPYTPQFARSSVFHGDMDSPEAEALLAKETDGTLLFRLSSRKGSLAVSYVFRGKVGHTLLKICFPDCYEYSGQVYNSVNDVIQGHSQIFKYIFDSSTLSRTSSALPQIYL